MKRMFIWSVWGILGLLGVEIQAAAPFDARAWRETVSSSDFGCLRASGERAHEWARYLLKTEFYLNHSMSKETLKSIFDLAVEAEKWSLTFYGRKRDDGRLALRYSYIPQHLLENFVQVRDTARQLRKYMTTGDKKLTVFKQCVENLYLTLRDFSESIDKIIGENLPKNEKWVRDNCIGWYLFEKGFRGGYVPDFERPNCMEEALQRSRSDSSLRSLTPSKKPSSKQTTLSED